MFWHPINVSVNISDQREQFRRIKGSTWQPSCLKPNMACLFTFYVMCCIVPFFQCDANRKILCTVRQRDKEVRKKEERHNDERLPKTTHF